MYEKLKLGIIIFACFFFAFTTYSINAFIGFIWAFLASILIVDFHFDALQVERYRTECELSLREIARQRYGNDNWKRIISEAERMENKRIQKQKKKKQEQVVEEQAIAKAI